MQGRISHILTNGGKTITMAISLILNHKEYEVLKIIMNNYGRSSDVCEWYKHCDHNCDKCAMETLNRKIERGI